MGAIVYSAYALAHATLTVLAVRQARRALTWTIAVVLVLAVTLTYDNVILVAGNAIGEGDTLLALSRPRFVIHAFVTPISIAVVLDQARRLGVSWAGTPRARMIAAGLTIAMIVLGVVELLELHLVAEEGMGLLHYSSAEASVPIPAVVSVIVMIVAGWAVRKQTGWSTLFLLGVVSFLGSAVPPIDGMLVLGNLVEVAFVAALLLAEVRAADAGHAHQNLAPSRVAAAD